MKKSAHGFLDLEEIKQYALQNELPLYFSDKTQVLFQPVSVEGFSVPNALAVLPMEGCDGSASGAPSPLTFRRYRRFAAGGSGVIWFEATAVVPQGKANPRHLYISQDNRASYQELVQETRTAARHSMGEGHNPLCILQLTHAGRYSKPAGRAEPVIAGLNSLLDHSSGAGPGREPVSDDELDELQNDYVQASLLARDAGFDGVDIKACHYYLVSELLAAHTRPGKYGGSLQNRARFLLETVDKVRAAAGQDLLITVRLNIYDGIPYPFGFGVDREDHTRPDLGEPLWLVEQLKQRGVKLLGVSIGNPYYIPHLGRPSIRPLVGGQIPDEHPLHGVSRLFSIAAAVQEKFPDIVVVGCGYSPLKHLLGYAAAANVAKGRVSIVGVGRMAFAYPDYARELSIKGELDPKKSCTCCSMCSQIMRDGGSAGCVIKDKDIYGPIYREGRRRSSEGLRRSDGGDSQTL